MHWVAITQYFLAGLKRPDLCCLILLNFHVYNCWNLWGPQPNYHNCEQVRFG